MGIISKLAKAGLAKKAYDEVRKPENQRRLKTLVAQARRRGGGTPTR
jgi:hypothetical protein